MPETQTKPKQEPKAAPATEAQLAKISELAENNGVEAPTPATADEAVEIIAALDNLDGDEDAGAEGELEPGDEDAQDKDGEGAEEAQARKGSERTDKQTAAMFERAVKSFREKLCVIFEVDDVSPASAPGVIGFLLPGFTEPKTHEDFTRCLTCNGFGTVLTGSMKQGEETRPCPDGRCKGRGYWERLHQPPPQAPAMPTPIVTGPTVYDPQPNGSGEFAEAPAWMGDPSISQGQPA